MTDAKLKQKTETKELYIDYNDLLTRLYMSLPDRTIGDSRFELPTVESIIQGKQTIWKNFTKCSKDLKREQDQLYKFVMKEISTSSTITNQTLVLNGIFNNYKLNQILTKYINNYVLCSACKKPDTEIVSQAGIKMLKCTACGAVTPLQKL